MLKAMYVFLAIAVITGVARIFLTQESVLAPVETEEVFVASPVAHEVLQLDQSTLVVVGKARGNWFFEGSLVISLVQSDGIVVGEGTASAVGEWTTEDMVDFRGEIYVRDDIGVTEEGLLILKKDNPSGLPEHDKQYEIPVRFAS